MLMEVGDGWDGKSNWFLNGMELNSIFNRTQIIL